MVRKCRGQRRRRREQRSVRVDGARESRGVPLCTILDRLHCPSAAAVGGGGTAAVRGPALGRTRRDGRSRARAGSPPAINQSRRRDRVGGRRNRRRRPGRPFAPFHHPWGRGIPERLQS